MDAPAHVPQPPGDPEILIVAFSGRIHGLDTQTGAIRWTQELHTPHAGAHVELHVDETRIVAACYDALGCLAYPTGQWLWRTTIPKRSHRMSLMVLRERIFVYSVGEVFAFDAHGRLLGGNPFTGFGFGPAALGVPGYVRQADVSDH